MKIETLRSANGPWVVKYIGQAQDLLSSIKKLFRGGRGVHISLLDGSKMNTLTDVYREMRTEFNFPSYFGNNLDALDECLSDPDIMTEDNYITILVNSDLLLKDEEIDKVYGFVETLKEVGEGWAKSNDANRENKIVPFHVILQFDIHTKRSMPPLDDLEPQ
jgi:RNAse (barnase) inhibitor barstar